MGRKRRSSTAGRLPTHSMPIRDDGAEIKLPGGTWVKRLLILDPSSKVLRCYDEDGVKDRELKIGVVKLLPYRGIFKRTHRWDAAADASEDAFISVNSSSSHLRAMFVEHLQTLSLDGEGKIAFDSDETRTVSSGSSGDDDLDPAVACATEEKRRMPS